MGFQVDAGNTVRVPVADGESITITTRKTAIATAISGLGLTPNSTIGIANQGTYTYGPYSAGYVNVAAFGEPATVYSGVAPVVSGSTLTGNFAVGGTVTAKLPTGTVGTIQFYRTSKTSPPVKTAISGAVANGVNSLNYVVTQDDSGFVLSYDVSNRVTTSGAYEVPAPVGLPLAPILESVVGFNNRADINVRSAAGETAVITGYRVTASPGGAVGERLGAGPGVVTVPGLSNGTAYTFVAEALYAGGKGPASAPSVSATPVANRVLHATMGGACVYDGVHASNTFGSIYFETVAAYDMPLGLSLRLANMAIVGDMETGGTSTDTWTGSLELGGTLIQLKAGAVSPISVPTKTVVETDRVGAGQITKGTVLKFRLNSNQPGKMKFFVYGDGDGIMRQKFGTTSTAVPDITMQMDQSSLTLVPVAQQQPLMLPFLIVGEVDGPSLAAKGDSISVARGDYAGSTVGRGYMGRAAKALGVAYAQMGKSGDKASAYVASNTIRRTADAAFTHIENNMGTNDVTSDRTAAQISADRATIIGHNTGKPQLWFNLIPNVSASSDGYTTVSGQTLRTQEPVRLQVNAELAAGIAGVRVIDINASLSAPGDPSRWGVGAGPTPWTIDAAHPTAAGAIVGAAGYDLSSFIKPV